MKLEPIIQSEVSQKENKSESKSEESQSVRKKNTNTVY